jgi:hypothetical protein
LFTSFVRLTSLSATSLNPILSTLTSGTPVRRQTETQLKEIVMKRNLIAAVLFGLASAQAGVAFADPTLVHEDPRWDSNKFMRVEATSYPQNKAAVSIEERLFNLNP